MLPETSSTAVLSLVSLILLGCAGGVVDDAELPAPCSSVAEAGQIDLDGDGLGAACDADDDGDGRDDEVDVFPEDPTEWADVDLDGIGDNADTETCDGRDNDGDGVADNGLVFRDAFEDPDGDGYYGGVAAPVQPSCAAWLLAGRTDDGFYAIDLDGDGGRPSMTVFCDMKTDGGGWTRVFYHDVADGYWAGGLQSLEYNVEHPDSAKYSILSALESFRSSDGQLDLRINWPATDTPGRNLWRQTSNPTTGPIAGYVAVDIDHAEYGWGGLELNTLYPLSFIDGSVGIGWWFYAIGATEPWSSPPGVPAASQLAAARVALWVRPDHDAVWLPAASKPVCGPVPGYSDQGGDCAPAEADVSPGRVEVCDSRDNDCDGDVDEGLDVVVWYPDRDGDGVGASAGSSCASLLADGETQDGVYLVRPDGPEGPKLTVFCDMTNDGGGWTRVFYHDLAGGVFTSNDDAKERTAGDPTSPLYSILSQFDVFRSSDGLFDLRLNWPDSAVPGRNLWRQRSDPTTAPVQGYEAVSVDYATQYWGGLEYSGREETYLDGSVGHTNWFYAIGARTDWKGGIPAYGPVSSRVALWVRPDDAVAGGTPVVSCKAPLGYVSAARDCNDGDPDVRPGAAERCDGVDEDCDGETDEGCPIGGVTTTVAPEALHFYGRDPNTNECTIALAGELMGAAKVARLTVRRDGAPYSDTTAAGDPTFEFEVPVEAGLHRYELTLSWDSDTGYFKPAATFTDILCGDVYLINGQSNAVAIDYHEEGLGDLKATPFVRSFGSSVQDASVASDPRFATAVANVGYTDAAIGQWGMQLALDIVAAQAVPVLVINGAVGGTTISEHQRNAANPTDLATIYGRLLWRVQEAGLASAVRAIVWHQGESDGAMPYDTYLGLWTAMYQGWLADYPNVEGVYTFQVRAGCGDPTWNRNVQREVSTLLDKVLGSMSTTGIDGHDDCHFHHATYVEWGKRMARLVNRDLYGTSIAGNIEAPSPISARWLDETHLSIDYGETGLGLELEAGAAAYFTLSDGAEIVDSTVLGPTVVLETAAPSDAGWVSFVDVPGDIPWLVNDLGIGGFAYYELPVAPSFGP